MSKKEYKHKLLWLSVFHRVVMIIAGYLYIDFIVNVRVGYGALAGAVALNAINMVIYYIYHYWFLKILKIEKGA